MIFNGTRLRELREARCWSKLDLSRKLSVADPQIGRWESGVCVPRMATIKRLSKVLGVAISELMIKEKETVGADV